LLPCSPDDLGFLLFLFLFLFLLLLLLRLYPTRPATTQDATIHDEKAATHPYPRGRPDPCCKYNRDD
jgi:hypothetical protein